MLIRNVTEQVLTEALRAVNERYDGNIMFLACERVRHGGAHSPGPMYTRQGGEVWRVRLTVVATKDERCTVCESMQLPWDTRTAALLRHTSIRACVRRALRGQPLPRHEESAHREYHRPRTVRETLPGVRLSPPESRQEYRQKRIRAACWHVHGHFMDALPREVDGREVTIRSGSMTQRGVPTGLIRPGDEWRDWNVGSRMYPFYASEACECP